MSRCNEHNQKITQFCFFQNCNSKQSYGCSMCIKKYHTHAGKIQLYQQSQIQQMMDKLIFTTDIKPKCRSMQQAIYNYLSHMKSQISTGLDALTRNIMNRLSSPYVQNSGYLPIYKKMKVHDYKKLSKEQINKFLQFLKQISKERQNQKIYHQLQQKQRLFYHEQSQIAIQIVQQINEIFSQLGHTLGLYQMQFDIGQQYILKIRQVNKHRIQAYEKKQSIEPGLTRQTKFRRLKTPSKYQQKSKQLKQQKITGTNKLKQFKQKIIQNNQLANLKDSQKSKFPHHKHKISQSISTNIKKQTIANQVQNNKIQQGQNLTNLVSNKSKQTPRKRGRKISIDMKHQIQGLKPPQLNPKTFEQNQKQIQQKKNKLLQMINSGGNNLSLHGSTKKSQTISQVKQQPVKMNTSFHVKKISDYSNRSDSETQEGRPRSRSINQKNNNKELFDNLISKGINLPDIIMHTILPAPQEKQKLFEHGKEIKKKMITIPMNTVPEQQEIASPLLKKKRISEDKQQFTFSLKPADQANHEVLARMPGTQPAHIHSAVKKRISGIASENKVQYQKQSQKKIQDNQINSLALLMKALPLSSSQAIPLLQLAVKQAQNNLSAAQYLSYLYLQQGKPRQCLDLCNKLLNKVGYSPQFDQLSIHLNNNKAAALNMLGRYSQSINILERCIRLQNNEVFYKNIADAYFQIGIPQKALLNYQRAVQLNQKYDEAYYNMAVCLYTQQHYLNAHQAILKANELIQGKNPDYNELKANIQIKIKEIK